MNANRTRFAGILALLAHSLHAQSLPPGTGFEVRFSNSTGSRISHRGDPIEGVVISPVSLNGNIAIPQGTRIRGTVRCVTRLGFGLKNRTARIQFSLDSLLLSQGQTIPIAAKVVAVGTGKERVDSRGMVYGVHPMASLSAASTFYTTTALFLNPFTGMPIWLAKTLIAPSVSPEIYFPAGTEFAVSLKSEVDVSALPIEPDPVDPLSEPDLAEAQKLLKETSHLRALQGKRPSDFVNLLFVGSRRDIDTAFHAAGWNMAERRSPMALYRLYNALTRRIGYGNAPMSKLRLGGKLADFAYQKSFNTISARHHVRFWKQSRADDVWLGAATEDVAIKFQRMHWTHRIDPAIDKERSKVVNDLAYTGCVARAGLVARALVPEIPRDRTITTDGDLAAVRFNPCRHPNIMPGVDAPVRPVRVLVRIGTSFRDDLIRFNPLFTAFNTVRCLLSKHDVSDI